MERIIKSMEDKYRIPSLELVETVFTEYDCPKEGKMVRSLVEEIHGKRYYLREPELIPGGLEGIHGQVNYSDYQSLR